MASNKPNAKPLMIASVMFDDGLIEAQIKRIIQMITDVVPIKIKTLFDPYHQRHL